MSEQFVGARRLVAVLAGMLVVGLVLGGLPGGPVATGGAATVLQSQPAVDNTVTRITVHENGSATWAVSIRTRLASDEAVREYEAFQDRFRENTSRYLGPFQRRIRDVVARAGNATGREMQAVNVSATTSIQELPRRWGLVTYRFTWTGFAQTNGDRLAVGDVFQGGYYLAEDDSIVIAPPSGYALASVSPSPAARENGTVRWRGPIDFGDERPSVTYEPAPASAGTTPPAGQPGGFPWVPLAAGAVLLAAGGAIYVRTREPRESKPQADNTTAGARTAAGGTAASGNAASGAGAITDEERVLELLDAHGGRVKQSTIADEFDWSASKASRVVSSMAESGAVEKLRIGRENLVARSDEQ